MKRTIVRAVCAAWIATALIAAAWPGSASACSCVGARQGRRVVPADGATGFPTDGVVRVFLTAFAPDLRSALAGEYRLRDAAGALVPLGSNVVGTRLDLTPRARLSPGARYTLEQVFAYGASGAQLSDSQRWTASRSGAGALRGAWFAIGSFRTGPGRAPRQQRAPTMDEPSLRFAYGGGDCGPGISVSAETRMPAGTTATDVLELQVQGQGTVLSQPAEGATRLYAGNMMCNPDPVSVAYSPTMRVRARLLDASGAELGASPWRAASGQPRGSAPTGRTMQSSVWAAGVAAWTAITVAPVQAVTHVGPSACPHGFERTSQREVASENAPWMYGARSTLATEGRRAWLAFQGGESPATIRLVRVARGGAPVLVPTSVSANPAALTAGSRGPVLVSHTYADGNVVSTVAAIDARRVGTRWSHRLPHQGGGYRIASGDDRVLVAWGARSADHRRFLTWTMFAERTGASVGRLHHTPLEIETGTTEGPTLAYLDDRFLLVWTSAVGGRPGPMTTMVVLADGTPQATREIAVGGDGIPDLAAAGSRGGFVNANAGHIQWVLLDRDGEVEAGPISVGSGVGGRDNRLPRIAWNGSVFAVAWETYPDAGVYVAAVDTSGSVSPALRLDQGANHAGTVGIAASQGGFLASYTVNRSEGVLARLRCRTTPSGGAPQQIRPAP